MQLAFKIMLSSVGLLADVSQKQFSSTVSEGLVISQTPEAGTKVEKGSKITAFISKGPEADSS